MFSERGETFGIQAIIFDHKGKPTSLSSLLIIIKSVVCVMK